MERTDLNAWKKFLCIFFFAHNDINHPLKTNNFYWSHEEQNHYGSGRVHVIFRCLENRRRAHRVDIYIYMITRSFCSWTVLEVCASHESNNLVKINKTSVNTGSAWRPTLVPIFISTIVAFRWSVLEADFHVCAGNVCFDHKISFRTVN